MKYKCILCREIEEDDLPSLIIEGKKETGSFYHKGCVPPRREKESLEREAEKKRVDREWELIRAYYREHAGLGRTGYPLGYAKNWEKTLGRTYNCFTTHDESTHMCYENMEEDVCFCTSCKNG